MTTTGESDGVEAAATPAGAAPWFDAPPLPELTDLDVFWEPGVCRVEFRVRQAARLTQYAMGWIAIVMAVGLTVTGALLVLGLALGGGAWLAPGGFAFVASLVLASPFLIAQATLDKRRATILITDDSIRIEDAHQANKLTLEIPRREVDGLSASEAGGRTLLFGENSGRPGSVLGLRFGRTWALCARYAGEEVGVLGSWEELDLRWLATAIGSAWGLAAPEKMPRLPKSRVANPQQKQDDRQLEITCAVGIIAFSLLGPAICVQLWDSAPAGWQSRDWPSTPGTVVSANYQVTGVSSKSFEATSTYRYEVGGQEFVGDRLSFSYADRAPEVERAIAGLAEGDSLVVFYDPDDPGRSVLVPGMSGDDGLGVGLVLMSVIGFVFCTFQFSRLRRVRHQSWDFSKLAVEDVAA